jgi:hypothetical protein
VSEYVKDDGEFDAIVEDRSKFNNLLKQVQTDAIQAVLRALPKVTTGIVSQSIYLYQKTADFYKEHPDLRPHGKVVGAVIDEVHSEHPDWTLDDVLKFVGGDGDKDIGEVRRRLKLKAQAADKAKDDNDKRRRPPNTDRAAHVRTPDNKVIKLSGIEKEISEMLEAVET